MSYGFGDRWTAEEYQANREKAKKEFEALREKLGHKKGKGISYDYTHPLWEVTGLQSRFENLFRYIDALVTQIEGFRDPERKRRERLRAEFAAAILAGTGFHKEVRAEDIERVWSLAQSFVDAEPRDKP